MYDEHGKMIKNTVEAKVGKPLNENGKVVPASIPNQKHRPILRGPGFTESPHERESPRERHLSGDNRPVSMESELFYDLK